MTLNAKQFTGATKRSYLGARLGFGESLLDPMYTGADISGLPDESTIADEEKQQRKQQEEGEQQ